MLIVRAGRVNIAPFVIRSNAGVCLRLDIRPADFSDDTVVADAELSRSDWLALRTYVDALFEEPGSKGDSDD